MGVPRITVNVPSLSDALEKWARRIDWLSGLHAVHPLTVSDTPSGPEVGLALPGEMFVKLTSSAGSGVYNAAEVYPSGAGAWTLVPSGWTGTAREFNGYAGVTTPAYVKAFWCPATADWRFQLGGCS